MILLEQINKATSNELKNKGKEPYHTMQEVKSNQVYCFHYNVDFL